MARVLIIQMKNLLVAFLLLTFPAFAGDPSFAFLNTGRFYPLSRELQFPYASTQVSNLDVVVSKCYVNNLNAYRFDSGEMKSRMTVVAKKRIELAPPYAEKTNRMLRLSEVADAWEPGFYHLKVDTGLRVKEGGSWWSWWNDVKDECLFALTDLGLAVKTSPSKDDPKAVVLVHSLKDGSPVDGAAVTVLTRANQVVAQGVTDGRGMAVLPFSAAFHPGEDEIYGIMATKGKDISYLQLDDESSIKSRDAADQRSGEDVRAYLFAERDICRPGESFDTGMFLRSSPQGGMKALSDAPVDLELYDPEDNRIESRRCRSDRWGFVAARWDVPSAARVGRWKVQAKLAGRTLGSFTVNVAAYVPDRFRVELKTDRTGAVPAFKGAAVYYFGENVREGNWKVAVEAAVAPSAPHWAGWTVGTDEIPDGLGWSEKGAVEEGAFAVAYPDERYGKLKASKSPVLLTVQASVTPPGARTVNAREGVRIDPTDRYIGIRETKATTRDARAFELAFLAAEKDGVAATNGEIAVKLIRREWKCHAVSGYGERYHMEWREERTELPALARRTGPGRIEYASADLASGSYQLVATCGELETRMDFWHWVGEVSERSLSPSALYLKALCEKAKPGESVSLTFDSAYEGMAYAAVGERGIEETFAFRVRKGENRFAVKVRPDAVSRHTYVAVTVINARAPNARRLFGLARVSVDHAAKRYPLALALPEVVRPGSTVDVAVRSDGPGAVRLMAVDEGVLALTGYEVPDAFSYFHNYDFGCPFDVHDLYSLVYPDLRILPNGQIGGGALAGAMKRRNVRTRRDSTLKQRETARVVLPLVEIPASGNVTVPVKLPEFTGAMRLMAVAVDESRAGGATATVIVRDAASLFVNAPRSVTGGDRFELVAEVFNHDLPESAWTLAVDGRQFCGKLAKGASTNVSITVVVPEDAIGVRRLKGELRIGGETYRDEVAMTMRPRHPSVTEVTYRHFPVGTAKPAADGTTNAWLRLDEDLTEEFGTPKAVIAGALQWLNAYPYGCLEQTAAAAFPFLSSDSLRAIGLADVAMVSNAAVKVKAAYGEIMQMALEDGSFSMWPGGRDAWTDGSLFALHFIFAAERRGLVRPSPREKMIGWLRKRADGNDPKTRLDRAYAAYVLSLAGDDRFANAAKNVLATNACDYASFLASAALVRGGYRADGELAFSKAVLSKVWEHAQLPASDGWSRARAYGMALTVATELLAVPGGNAAAVRALEPLVGKLMAMLRTDGSAWGTTRDNAWASAGLAEYCAACPGGGVFVRRIRSGIPRNPSSRPSVIRVSRDFPGQVKKGDLVEVEISISAAQPVDRAVLCDLVPGGFELEDAALKTRAADDDDDDKPGRSEIRDDRWLWFGRIPKCREDEDPFVLRYRLRAVVRGTFAVPALRLEDMYDPDVFGEVKAGSTVVVE